MDPRPYHFEYRRPRLSNPTYQSSKLYDSLFILKDASKPVNTFRLRNPQVYQKSFTQDPQPELKRANSTEINGKKIVEVEGIGSYRYGAKGNLEQADKGNRSKMASFGNNLLRNSSMDQTQVYKRQEKEFNIINFHPKEYKPNLRQFPKLTVEDKLNEGIKQRKND